MLDNFEQITSLLKFDSEDDFYHLQIIQRKKDNPGLPGKNNNSRCVKTYYISSVEYLMERMNEIIATATIHNARACINLNRRSYENIAFQALQKITNQIMNKEWRSVRNAYESVCGTHSNEGKKKWIIDIDVKDREFVAHINHTIHHFAPVGDKYIAQIETKNGYHLITKPFNMMEFKVEFPNIDVHKDNPTILYVP